MRDRKRWGVGAAILFVIVIGSFWIFLQDQKKAEIPPCPDCNVILISLDTLRADSMGLYGYERNTTPNLDRRAEKAIVFDRMFANAYFTLPSHMSIFTSLYPPTHGVNYPVARGNDVLSVLSGSHPTLPEILKNYEYRTVWIGSLIDPNLNLNRGFGRGFDVFYLPLFSPGSWVKKENLSLIASQETGQKFFWFVHGYINHVPYIYTEPFNSHFSSMDYQGSLIRNRSLMTEKIFYELRNYYTENKSGTEERIDKLSIPRQSKDALIASLEKSDVAGYLNFISSNTSYYWGVNTAFSINENDVYYSTMRGGMSEEDISELRNSYDNGVYLVDSLVEEFLQVLDEKNLSQKTIIIITADHGEELYEHQNFDHSVFYDTVVHVPLIIIHPGVHEQIRINSLAESVDIMPTILSFLQIPSPASLQGKDLTAIYKGEIPKHSYVKGYALGNSYIRSPEWKYIKRRDGQEEFYDLESDPDEMHNLINESGWKVEKAKAGLKEEFTRWIVQQESG